MGERSTAITLYKDVPLQPDYKHTLYFIAREAQAGYFSTAVSQTVTNYSYQRWELGRVKVELPFSQVIQHNYMSFINSSYENKRFYAFITGVNYINDITTEIEYKIDAIQTFWFDVEVKAGFVEREHVEDDSIGLNIVPEDVGLGPYVWKYVGQKETEVAVGLISSSAPGDVPPEIKRSNSIFTATYNAFQRLPLTGNQTAGVLNDLISLFKTQNKLANILGVFILPGWVTYSGSTYTSTRIVEVNDFPGIYGYTPRNRKLYTYPYCFLEVTNNRGSINEYRYEWFYHEKTTEPTAFKPSFSEWFEFSLDPTTTLTPVRYGMETEIDGLNKRAYMTIKGYPMIGIGSDAYTQWAAAQGLGFTLKSSIGLIGGFGTAIAGGLTGNIPLAVGGALTGANTFANTVSTLNEVRNSPDTVMGQTSSQILMLSGDTQDFGYYHKCITKEMAEVIDGYFDMFGYRVCKVKKPNIGTRPEYNYVKMQNAVIVGHVPSTYEQEIVNCLNNGITFWRRPSNVGDYTVDNTI